MKFLNFFLFQLFSMFSVKFFSESSREFFKFEPVNRNLVLLLIKFEEENACSFVCVVPRIRIILSEIF